MIGPVSGRWPALRDSSGLRPAGRRVGGVVSVTDVAPTLLEMAGLPSEEGQTGRSLLSPGPPVALFFTDYAVGWLGLRDGCWKYLYEVEARRPLLFDVCADPGETIDRAGDHPERETAYRARVEGWSSATRSAILAGR